MAKPKTQIGDEVRSMTDAEFAQYQQDQIDEQARMDALAAKAIARQAVLDKLGLTAEELAALL